MTDQDTHFNRFNEPAAIDELMDRVAGQLQSQMNTANEKLRLRAARMLSPVRTNRDTRPGNGRSEAGADSGTDSGAGTGAGTGAATGPDTEPAGRPGVERDAEADVDASRRIHPSDH